MPCQVRDLTTIADTLFQKLQLSGISSDEIERDIDQALSQPRLSAVSISTYQLSKKLAKLNEENVRLQKMVKSNDDTGQQPAASTLRRSSAPPPAASSSASSEESLEKSSLEEKLLECQSELALEKQRAERLVQEVRSLQDKLANFSALQAAQQVVRR